jgi:hypothetical protein
MFGLLKMPKNIPRILHIVSKMCSYDAAFNVK